ATRRAQVIFAQAVRRTAGPEAIVRADAMEQCSTDRAAVQGLGGRKVHAENTVCGLPHRCVVYGRLNDPPALKACAPRWIFVEHGRATLPFGLAAAEVPRYVICPTEPRPRGIRRRCSRPGPSAQTGCGTRSGRESRCCSSIRRGARGPRPFLLPPDRFLP